MGQSEPPSGRLASLPRLFRIGRDSNGNWVVQDQQRLCGGLFADRVQAVKFAMFENGNCPQAVIMVPRPPNESMKLLQARAAAEARTDVSDEICCAMSILPSLRTKSTGDRNSRRPDRRRYKWKISMHPLAGATIHPPITTGRTLRSSAHIGLP